MALQAWRKNMREHLLVVIAVIVVLAAVTYAADDPFIGTWKLNVAKSTISGPLPQSEILKVIAQNNGFEWAFDTVSSDGKTIHSQWSGKYDGKDYSNTGNADIDAVATKRINANTLDTTLKRGGNVVGTGQCLVSNSGKTLTLTEKLKNAQGKQVAGAYVYDKQ